MKFVENAMIREKTELISFENCVVKMRMKRKGVVVVALLLLYRSPDASQAAKSKNMRADSLFPPHFDNIWVHRRFIKCTTSTDTSVKNEFFD
jgi:hypothetical protein